ncbi:MAG: EF-hand domain-containing protein, partial [Actinobacteria bacterium]|nr:EF-hand domain-containing protein [Actinomycetota bacterium]
MANRRCDEERSPRNLCAAKGVGPGSPEYDAILAGFAVQWQGFKGRADARGDGQVDFDEWCSFVGEILEEGDRYAGFANPIVDSIFSMLDQDGDGVISEEEYSAIWQAGAHDGGGAPAVYRRLLGDGGRGMSIDDM